ncbi:MAG: hypothetical protein J6Q22_10885 [Prevotella sp.]|nr:hypothetical protein [Prevotella sp.]
MKKTRGVGISAEQPMITNDIAVSLGVNNDGLLKSLDICIPVCVYSFERDTHKVVVIPLVKQAYFKGKWKYVDRVPFTVKMRSIQCGGFAMDFPVYVGDTGWVFSSDRDTTFLKDEDSPTTLVLGADRKSGVVEDVLPQPPKQPRIHSLPDGFFIPDNWGKWDYSRFKDSDDIKLQDALYIGTSFYDEDEEEAPDEEGKEENQEEEDEEEDEDSDDGTYEGNPSVSIVLAKDGSVNFMSSSKESEKKTAHLKMKKDKLGLKMVNGGSSVKLWEKVESFISLDEGMALDCKGENSNYAFTFDKNGIEIKYNTGDAAEGKSAVLTLSSTFDLNISTPGKVFLSAGDVTTQCENITATGKDVTFNVENVTGTVGNMTINSSSDINIRSSGQVSVASEEGVSIGSAGNIEIGGAGSAGTINITSLGGSVHISAAGSEDGSMTLESSNGTITMDSDGISLIGDKVNISGELNFDTTSGRLNGSQFIAGGSLIIT